MLYFTLKFVHIVGATVLLGTGAGIAFFLLFAHRTGDVRLIAGVARIVVIADFLFTASAVIVQPLTGAWLAHIGGYPMLSGWIGSSLLLYILTGVFWLPVVWMQIRMRRLAEGAIRTQSALPAEYHRLFRLWFAFGFPAFGAVLAILWLMVTKPG
jgi:uncharacterized membrane protein